MPTKGYDDPASKGGAGDPPGKAKGVRGGKNPGPVHGYSDGAKDDGSTQGPTIDNKGGGKGTGYDGAGIGSDTSRSGHSKKKSYPG
jgi:hypothetical protein